MPRSRTARHAKRLGAAVSVACVAGIVAWALGQEPPRLEVTAGTVAAFAGAIGLYAANTLLRAERWQRLLERHARPARADTYALTAVGYFGNNVLPARLGDVLRVVILAPRGGGSKREVAGTLLAERVLDVLVLLGLFAFVAATLIDDVRVPDPSASPLVLGLALVAVALAAAAAVAYARRRGVRRLAELLRPLTVATLQLRGRHGLAMLVMTLAIWALEACVWWTAGVAAGLRMNGAEAVYLVSMASLFSMIPSGPGYVGTQDAAALIGASAIGAPAGVALAYLLVVRFVLVVPVTLAGFLLLVTRYRGTKAWRGPAASAT